MIAPMLADINEQLDLPDVPFYADLARRAGPPAVELGIGDGRVARHVLPEVGVDNSCGALTQCRKRTGHTVRLIEADLADYQLERKANLSYAALNTVNHIADPVHLRNVLRNVRAQTAPGGILAFDAALPDFAKLRARDMVVVQRFASPSLRWEDATEVVSLADGLVHVHITLERLDRHGRVVERQHASAIPFRFLQPDEICADLAMAGWRLIDMWGDFARGPLLPGGRTAVCLAQAW